MFHSLSRHNRFPSLTCPRRGFPVALETLESRDYLSAAVAATIQSIKIPDLIVPGDKGSVSINIANSGDAAGAGNVKINVFASTDQAISGDDIPVDVSGFDSIALNLAAGKSKTFTGNFIVPDTIVQGNYFLVIRLSVNSGFGPGIVSTADVATSQSVQAGWMFGAVGSRKNVKFSKTLTDGTVATFSLSGAGTGTVLDAGGGNISLSLDGTSDSSTLKVSAKGGSGVVPLAGITDTRNIGTLNAPVVVVNGNLTLNGNVKKITLAGMNSGTLHSFSTPATSLSLGTVRDVNIDFHGAISSLAVNSWSSTGSNMITTPFISTLKCGGNFNANLALSAAGAPAGVALKSVNIQGNIDGGTWNLLGAAGSIHVFGGVATTFSLSATGALSNFTTEGSFRGDLAAASISTFLVKGGVIQSHILAGATFGADGVLGGNDDTFASGTIKTFTVLGGVTTSLIAAGLDAGPDNTTLTNDDALIAGGKISSLSIAGSLGADCHILAASLPAKVKIAGTQVATNGDPRFTL